MTAGFAETYLAETKAILDALDLDAINSITNHIRDLDGRLFILGVGGSAATASHAVNDFRKLAGVECYTPTDNVAELTARTNDHSWDTVFTEWLLGSHLTRDDAVLVFSVGGGRTGVSPGHAILPSVSANLVWATQFAQRTGAKVLGIVGRDGGATAVYADACVVIPPLFPDRITPHTESVAAVLLHLIVTELACSR